MVYTVLYSVLVCFSSCLKTNYFLVKSLLILFNCHNLVVIFRLPYYHRMLFLSIIPDVVGRSGYWIPCYSHMSVFLSQLFVLVVVRLFLLSECFLDLFGFYQAVWFPLSFQLVGRYTAILDLSLLDLLNLVRMIKGRTNINADSSEVNKFIVNHHSVLALFYLSLLRTAKLRKVL